MASAPFNRSNWQAFSGMAESSRRMVGGGESAAWPSVDGGTIVDLTPAVYVARLNGQRIGAAYGWDRVFVSADDAGVINIEVAAEYERNNGTPTELPAIEPNGNTDLAPGTVALIWPCEQGGTWQYIIVGLLTRGGFPYPYSYGSVELDAIVLPLKSYRCNGNNLEESIEWWLINAPGISATVSLTNPNADGVMESGWYCVGGECVESTVPPEGFNSGPYATHQQCAANCI